MKFSFNKLFFILFLNIVGLVSFSHNKTYVPDDTFEAFLEANNDSVITANQANVNSLYVFSKNITDLIVLEDFLALSILYFENYQLSRLNIKQNTILNF